MLPAYDTQAPKRSANLSINADLLTRAKALNINLSAAFERALIQALKEKQIDEWVVNNREAIEAYNDLVEQQGVFSDGLRNF
ncbi:MAG TPA: type II toxin-antitoxin system CcdA family antitoxin [Chromatiaceae bacterium]|jgi:antitoxin CcdA|nr:type II toxin-antitoxin system CcdA family antitoxin [Chromatiaceae bacterium]